MLISSIAIAALISGYDLDPVVNLKSVVRGTEELYVSNFCRDFLLLIDMIE